MKTRLIRVCACAVLLCVLAVTVTAVLYSRSSGSVVQYIANRVNITVDNTEFEFDSAEIGDTLTCTLYVTIEKTEPDFYGLLNSIYIDGIDTISTVFTAGEDNGSANLPLSVYLPASDDEVYALEWEVSFSFEYDGQDEYELSLVLDYTTGVSADVTQQYITTVPITVSVG